MDTWENGLGGMIGVSPAMQRMYSLIMKVSGQQFPVLITGETGTGKEMVARSIHSVGKRSSSPFLPVDCAGLVATLIEAELFGHKKGSFTGADENRAGLLASAKDGTLFFDEIGELPLPLQPKLLRALQEGQFRAVGSTAWQPYGARVLAATNRDLASAMLAGTFREDLFFRLNVVNINVPPLRDRSDDIPLLVQALMEKYDGLGTRRRVSDKTMHNFQIYDWPGNIRELENVVQRSLYLSDDTIIDSDLLLPEQVEPTDEVISLGELEHRAIRRAMRTTNGDVFAAAKLLGIGKTTIYRKAKLNGYSGPAGFLARK